MTRRVFVQYQVLDLYQRMESITFPIQPSKILPLLPVQCRMMSYQSMSKSMGVTVRDLADLSGSMDGATHYCDGKFLILYNSQINPGRLRWTQCHEIGHVLLRHFTAAENGVIHTGDADTYKQLENEADFFAWNLIAPLPLVREMGVRSAEEMHRVYGLSRQAASLHWNRYCEWCRSHIKTAWDNKLLYEYRHKRPGSVPKHKRHDLAPDNPGLYEYELS